MTAESGPFGQLIAKQKQAKRHAQVSGTVLPPPVPAPVHLKAGSIDELKQRLHLYKYIVGQLQYDGHPLLAQKVASTVNSEMPCPTTDHLFQTVKSETNLLDACIRPKDEFLPIDDKDVRRHLDLEFETDIDIRNIAIVPSAYETVYVTSHKNSCRAATFSPSIDGITPSTLCATGSTDASIKILDVDRMIAKSQFSNPSNMLSSRDQQESNNTSDSDLTHPVIRTLYDHWEEVTCLEFHPKHNTTSILVSGSRDCTIKIFDYTKMSARRASKSISEASPILDLSVHPSGDFVLVGCEQPTLRLYDLNTSQCFVGAVPNQQHISPITAVQWSFDGKTYASASMDGCIKLWDGVSSQCITSIDKAHNGAPIGSIQFSRNGKYLLSSGKDSSVKLWELSTVRALINYTGAGTTGKQQNLAQAIFNHTEDYVLFPDEATTSLCVWNTRSAGRQQLLALGHNGPVRKIAHSPSSPAMLTCSDDFRARFWFYGSSTATSSSSSGKLGGGRNKNMF